LTINIQWEPDEWFMVRLSINNINWEPEEWFMVRLCQSYHKPLLWLSISIDIR
jgi:hypothetical protein